MTTPVLVMLIGLAISLVFTKWTKIADGWVARQGEIMFWSGLIVWLFSVSGKTAFDEKARKNDCLSACRKKNSEAF